MSEDPRREPPEAGSLAFIFVVLVLVFAGIGYLLDRLLHTLPWLMVAGVFVGGAVGLGYMGLLLFRPGSDSRKRKKGKDGGHGSKGPLA